MLQKYIVPENLSTFDYYKRLIPTYLQESFGFVDQYKIFFDIGYASKESSIINLYPISLTNSNYSSGVAVTNVTLTDKDVSFTAAAKWSALKKDTELKIKTIGTGLLLDVGEIYSLSSVTIPDSKHSNVGPSDNTYYAMLTDENGTVTKCYGQTTFIAKTRVYYLSFIMKQGLELGLTLTCKISMKKLRQSSIISTMRDVFNSLNVFNKNDDGLSTHINTSSIEYLNFLNTIRESTTSTDILDKLASLYGVSRNFSVEYTQSSQTVKKVLSLTDEALLLLIKCQIIKNSFDGTFEQSKKLYDMIGLPVMILTSSSEEAHCRMILLRKTDNDYIGKSNPLLGVEDMFLSGLLTIQSLGIKYTYEIITSGNIAIFDDSDESRAFDQGQFVR